MKYIAGSLRTFLATFASRAHEKTRASVRNNMTPTIGADRHRHPPIVARTTAQIIAIDPQKRNPNRDAAFAPHARFTRRFTHLQRFFHGHGHCGGHRARDVPRALPSERLARRTIPRRNADATRGLRLTDATARAFYVDIRTIHNITGLSFTTRDIACSVIFYIAYIKC